MMPKVLSKSEKEKYVKEGEQAFFDNLDCVDCPYDNLRDINNPGEWWLIGWWNRYYRYEEKAELSKVIGSNVQLRVALKNLLYHADLDATPDPDNGRYLVDMQAYIEFMDAVKLATAVLDGQTPTPAEEE